MPRPNVRNLDAIRNGTASHAQLYEAFYDLMTAVSNTSDQTNSNPNGPVPAPPQVSSVTAVALAPGLHHVQVEDNSPVQRGVIYHFEFSLFANFPTGTVILAQSSPSRDALINTGAGGIFWRAYSQYPTSAPSPPVYASGAVDAGGSARLVGISGAGSGTEPSVRPLGGAGFGFNTNRLPRD